MQRCGREGDREGTELSSGGMGHMGHGGAWRRLVGAAMLREGREGEGVAGEGGLCARLLAHTHTQRGVEGMLVLAWHGWVHGACMAPLTQRLPSLT